MILLVNDANILIDLLKADLIKPFFQLHFEFHVTDFVAAEIQESNADQLETHIRNGNLSKWSFKFTELQKIQNLEILHRKLSIPDCSCLYLAEKLPATLLTGDAALRGVAEQENIPVHGVLWIFDKLVKHRLISPNKALRKLKKLMTINTRLPLEECMRRVRRWSKG